MHPQARFFVRVARLLTLAAAFTALPAADVRGQSGVNESWRDSAGNWTGRRHALDPAGNLLVLGDTVVGDVIQVRKYSPAGQLLWSRIYDPAERVVSFWIATDPDGNAWVAAARITGSQNSRVGFLVLKYDSQGSLIFTDVTAGGMAVRAVTDSAGNGYVIGNGWITGGADTYMVVKYAPDGRRLWTGFLESGSSTFLAGPTSLALSPDETRLAVTGGNFSTTWRSFSLAMFDTASGQRLWNHLDTSNYGGRDVAFSPDGASVYVGSTNVTVSPMAMALARFDLAGHRIFSRSYADGNALVRIALDTAGNVVAVGTALPLPGSAYRDWMTIKTDAAGTQLWSRRYDATRTNDEVPEWVTVDGAGAVYVAGMGGPSPSTGNVSFLKPVTLKYDAVGTPVWAIFDGGNAQVTVSDSEGGSVFTLASGQMTSARFEQTGSADPVPAAPTQLVATGDFNGVESRINLAWTDNATSEFWHAVERCAGAGCSGFVEIGRALGENGTGFRDTPLPSGATYTYRVRAVGFTGTSGYSNPATASTPGSAPPPVPTAPMSLAASASVRRRIDLTWTNTAADATSITVQRCTGTTCTAFADVARLAATATSWADLGVKSRTTYRYRLYASGDAGTSPYSNIASATAR